MTKFLRLCGLSLLVALGSVGSAAAQTLRAHFLDVGQGSAAIIETECSAILVDTSGEHNNEFNSTASLIDQIEDFFFGRPHLDRTFDLFVLSHPHIDHTRGVNAGLQKYKVRELMLAHRLSIANLSLPDDRNL